MFPLCSFVFPSNSNVTLVNGKKTQRDPRITVGPKPRNETTATGYPNSHRWLEHVRGKSALFRVKTRYPIRLENANYSSRNSLRNFRLCLINSKIICEKVSWFVAQVHFQKIFRVVIGSYACSDMHVSSDIVTDRK